MKHIYYKDREINNNAVEYPDGSVMIQYLDTGAVDIVDKKDIEVRDE